MRFRSRRPIRLETTELRRAFSTFRPALRGQRLRVTAAVLLALAATALELLRPWPVTWVIDHLVAADPDRPVALRPIVGAAIVAVVVPALLGLANERLQIVVATVSRKATVRIRSGRYPDAIALFKDALEHIQKDLEAWDMATIFSLQNIIKFWPAKKDAIE